MKYAIRQAIFEDCAEIARIHVHAWQQAYAGLVPQDYLDGMSIPARQKKWEDIFRGTAVEDNNLYLARDDNRAVGFISFGRNRDKRKKAWGEIYAIYLLKSHWRKAIGHALFEKAGQKLRNDGMASAYLWALDTNENALAAYRKWGGAVDPRFVMDAKIGGQDIREVMINFDLMKPISA